LFSIKGSFRQKALALPFAIAGAFIISQSAFAGPISALDIIPTFESNITSDPNAAAIEGIINTAISFYNNNLTTATASPVNVLIDFQEGGGLGGSLTGSYGVSYSNNYLPALAAANSGDATDTTALAGLPATEPISGGDQLDLKSANGRALGLNTPGFINGSYDGQITLNTSLTTPGSPGSSLQYSLLAVTEHEIDEVLGLGSDEGDATGGDFFSHPAPEDLFRYTTGDVRAWNQSTVCGANSSGPLAFFSLDGTTDLSVFNNCNNGGDYGDWYSAAGDFPGFLPQVQDAFATPGSSPFLVRSSPEVVALDAIGYNLSSAAAATPEPGTLVLFGGGLAALAFYRRRATRRSVSPTRQ
jgi:PEP-CTERM motif